MYRILKTRENSNLFKFSLAITITGYIAIICLMTFVIVAATVMRGQIIEVAETMGYFGLAICILDAAFGIAQIVEAKIYGNVSSKMTSQTNITVISIFLFNAIAFIVIGAIVLMVFKDPAVWSAKQTLGNILVSIGFIFMLVHTIYSTVITIKTRYVTPKYIKEQE